MKRGVILVVSFVISILWTFYAGGMAFALGLSSDPMSPLVYILIFPFLIAEPFRFLGKSAIFIPIIVLGIMFFILLSFFVNKFQKILTDTPV